MSLEKKEVGRFLAGDTSPVALTSCQSKGYRGTHCRDVTGLQTKYHNSHFGWAWSWYISTQFAARVIMTYLDDVPMEIYCNVVGRLSSRCHEYVTSIFGKMSCM